MTWNKLEWVGMVGDGLEWARMGWNGMELVGMS